MRSVHQFQQDGRVPSIVNPSLGELQIEQKSRHKSRIRRYIKNTAVLGLTSRYGINIWVITDLFERPSLSP